MRIAKTVAGVFVLEDGTVVAQDRCNTNDPDALVDYLTTEQPLEAEYSDAEPVALSLDRIAALGDLSRDTVRERQVAAATAFTRQELSEAGGRDQLLVQAVRALDDLDELNNEKSERLRPWLALHFPELEDAVSDNVELAEIIAETAHRDQLDDYADLAADSTGMQFTGEDATMLQRFARQLRDDYMLRNDLKAYVEDLAEEVVPNLSAVLGPVLAARVLSLAGSLDKLAKMPASTIQVLGAEKAMFRHMRGEGDAPKHGVLFMHEYVQQVAADDRGEMARVIANKAAIAARLDRYGDKYRGDELRNDIDDRFDDIRS